MLAWAPQDRQNYGLLMGVNICEMSCYFFSEYQLGITRQNLKHFTNLW